MKIIVVLLAIILAFPSCQQPESESKDLEKVPQITLKEEETVIKSNFRAALDSLFIHSKYQYEVVDFQKVSIDSSRLIEFVELGIKDNIDLDSFPIKDIERTNIAFIRGKRAMSERLYARGSVEEFICKTEEDAEKLVEYMDKYKGKTAEWIALGGKGPMTYFHVHDRFYHVLTGGEYMFKEDKNVKELLLKYLK
jgi:hypothetical protein